MILVFYLYLYLYLFYIHHEYAYLEYEDNEDDNNVEDQPQYIPEIWKKLRIRQADVFHIVNISNRGRVKPEGTFQEAIAANGTHLRGTPYMVTRIGTNDYYIHELVWYAFVGPIPKNYEVRHKMHYVVKRAHKTYCNRAECLEIYPITITRVDV